MFSQMSVRPQGVSLVGYIHGRGYVWVWVLTTLPGHWMQRDTVGKGAERILRNAFLFYTILINTEVYAPVLGTKKVILSPIKRIQFCTNLLAVGTPEVRRRGVNGRTK